MDAAVGVEDEAGQRLAAPDGHAEGGESEICVDAVGDIRQIVLLQLLICGVFTNRLIQFFCSIRIKVTILIIFR